MLGLVIVENDKPDPQSRTARLRRMVTKPFTVRRSEELRPRGQELADGLVDARAAPAGDGDLLGVPYEDRDAFRRQASAWRRSASGFGLVIFSP